MGNVDRRGAWWACSILACTLLSGEPACSQTHGLEVLDPFSRIALRWSPAHSTRSTLPLGTLDAFFSRPLSYFSAGRRDDSDPGSWRGNLRLRVESASRVRSSFRVEAGPSIEWRHRGLALHAGPELALQRRADAWRSHGALRFGGRTLLGPVRLEIGARASTYAAIRTRSREGYLDPDSVWVDPSTWTERMNRRYQDAHLRVLWSRGGRALGAHAGYRFGASPGPRAFGGIEAVVRLSPRVAFLADHAYEPSLPEESRAGRSITRAGFALDVGKRVSSSRDPSHAPRSAPTFRVRKEADGCAVEIWIPRALTVEIAGDYSDWIPEPMTREPGGWWAVRCALAAGPQRFSVRVDGGPWTAPPGLPPVRDEYGSEAGTFRAP